MPLDKNGRKSATSTTKQTAPKGNSQSFQEGCVAYTEDPDRADPDEDDEGNVVGEEPPPREDGDE
jgi:hypothetical protein